jgi:peptidase M28-like protein
MQPRHLCLPLIFTLAACASHKRIGEASVRAHLEFLASDAMNGRASGTRDEQISAEYVAAQFRALGFEPPDSGGYVQTIGLTRRTVTGTPTITIGSAGNAAPLRWTAGKEFIAVRLLALAAGGPLQRIRSKGDTVQRGAIAFVNEANMEVAGRAMEQGAAAVLIRTEMPAQRWTERAAAPIRVQAVLSGIPAASQSDPIVVLVSGPAADALQSVIDGTRVDIDPATGEPETSHTYNAVGILRGRDAALDRDVILVTSHLDHLGRRDSAPGADKIFNGADDDASGTVAVIEIAQAFAARRRPKRTVIFACFGSEEEGGYGATYFREKPPVPLEKIVANVEFEMIGRPDPKVPPHTLWLTGFDRSDLGRALASHGARLVADPHPDQNFFQRSDNYTLARRGVVAHTVSSYGLHREYHTPEDETRLVDYPHLRDAIDSMIEPIVWLANSTFRPGWTSSGRP